MDLAGRAYARVYKVQARQDIHAFLLEAVESSGGRVLYASGAGHAPVYLGVQSASDQRIGLLVYPFRMTQRSIRNRPEDEVRGQIRYGGEASWAGDHPVGQDIAGVDITLLLGVHLSDGLFVGLQPALYDPLPMGISFYAKSADLRAATDSGWHVWEKENKAGSRRRDPRAPTGLETMVAFTPDRLLDYARFERQASDLGLDQPLRFTAASTAGVRRDGVIARAGLHALEEEFALSSQEIMQIISTRNRLQVAVRGGVAEHHLERVFQADPGVATVYRLDQDAHHDFDVTLVDDRQVRVECKNASPEPYASGDFKVEVQKTRASKNDPASRYYRVEQFDVIAACMYSPTRRWSFRYRPLCQPGVRHQLPENH